jgi:hypothetical protein
MHSKCLNESILTTEEILDDDNIIYPDWMDKIKDF